MIVGSFSKRPDALKDYKVDWSDQLDAGDTISTSSWAIAPAGTSPALVSEQEDVGDDYATTWLSGGQVGIQYVLTNTIETVGGRTQLAEIACRVSYLQLGVTSLIELDDADAYFAAVENSTWLALKAGAREAYLLRATRLLDRQRWRGAKASEDQALAWPRSGITLDGVTVGDDEYPQQLRDACCEVALALAGGSDVEDAANQSQKVQSIKAGSVSVSYFRGAEGDPVRFPQIIHELLRDMLAQGQTTVYGVASGVSGESLTEQDLGFTQGL